MNSLLETENDLSDPKSGQKMAKRAASAKGGKYWATRVFLGKTTRRGKTYYTSNYYVRIQHAGKRELFCLNTADKAAAIKQAEGIYYLVRSAPDGWQNALEKYGKTMIIRKDDPTVGEYLEALRGLSGMDPQTLIGYARKLRRVTAEIFVNEHIRQANKYDAKANGRKNWAEAVDKIPVRELTDEAIRRWQVKYVNGRRGNPVEEQRAKHTVDGILRSCKSLFGRKYVKWVKHLRLPDPLPFRGLELMTRGLSSYRYRSKIDPFALLEAAKTELRPAKPEPPRSCSRSCTWMATRLRNQSVSSARRFWIRFIRGLAPCKP